MNFHGKGMYQWDTWYCKKKDTEEIHAFYLQELRPGSERSRFEADSLGHAVSYNLLDWKELPSAITPEPVGETGDLTNWTGSTLEHEGKYYMFYTIRSSASDGKHQYIGLATSEDMNQWEKYSGNPILSPDPRWYNTLQNTSINNIMDCRDLMVVKHDLRPGYYGVFATRIPTEELPEGAVFAGAYSEDLIHWEQTPPIIHSKENQYSIVEMPDLFEFEGKWYLTWLEDTSYGKRDILGDMFLTSGTVYAVADKLEGPYIEPEDNILIASMGFNGLSCRTVDFKGKKYVLYTMAERVKENETKHTFGALALPKEIKVIEGKLSACIAADLLREKLRETLIEPEEIPKQIDYYNCHETPGSWMKEDGFLYGNVRTTWGRYTFDVKADNFLYSANVMVTKGVAAGLLIRQGENKSGGVALLDYERQLLMFCTIPRFQIVDMRKLKLEYGRSYHIQVIGNDKFIEVYVDSVLMLQFVWYFSLEGRFGLLIDRAEGRFDNISAQRLEIN
ncbi:MAG: hypothetical protein QM644_11300 [Mobilitalea sp.]